MVHNSAAVASVASAAACHLYIHEWKARIHYHPTVIASFCGSRDATFQHAFALVLPSICVGQCFLLLW